MAVPVYFVVHASGLGGAASHSDNTHQPRHYSEGMNKKCASAGGYHQVLWQAGESSEPAVRWNGVKQANDAALERCLLELALHLQCNCLAEKIAPDQKLLLLPSSWPIPI